MQLYFELVKLMIFLYISLINFVFDKVYSNWCFDCRLCAIYFKQITEFKKWKQSYLHVLSITEKFIFDYSLSKEGGEACGNVRFLSAIK